MSNKNRNYSMVGYFNRRAENFGPRYRFNGVNPEEFESWKQKLFPELKQALGPMPESVPLDPEIVWEISQDGLGYTLSGWYIFVPPGGTLLLRRLHRFRKSIYQKLN